MSYNGQRMRDLQKRNSRSGYDISGTVILKGNRHADRICIGTIGVMGLICLTIITYMVVSGTLLEMWMA